MKKIASFVALVLISAMSFAGSIGAPASMDFGTYSIKGKTYVQDSLELSLSPSGISDWGIGVEVVDDAEYIFSASDSWLYANGTPDYYGVKKAKVYFTATKAGTFTAKLRLTDYNTEAYEDVALKVVVTNEAIVAKTIPFERVTSLSDGDTIIFVSEAAGAVCGPLNTTYLPAITEGVTIDATAHKAEVPETGVQMFRATKHSGNWQFRTADADAKRLHLDVSGKGAFTYAATSSTVLATWKVEISSSGAVTMCRPSDESFPVEFNSNRFKPYKSPLGTTFQIYKKVGSAVDIQSKLEVGAIDFGSVELGEEKEVVVNYTGENLTEDIMWDITGADKALFSVTPDVSTDRTSGSVTVKYLGTAAAVKTINAKLYALTQDAALDPMEKEVSISITLVPNTIKLTKIEFVGAPDSLVKGKSIDLKPYLVFTPGDAADKSLTWTVDKSYQGTVEDGVYTAKNVTGSVTITATSVKVPSVSASVTLMQYEPKPASITLDKHEITTYIGETVTLQGIVSPDGASQDCYFTIRNKDILTYAKGDKTGSAKLTAKALCQEGTWVVVNPKNYQTILDSCLVKVIPVTVESVAFDPDTKEMTVGAQSQLTPVVTPAAAASQYTASYESNNTAVVTVDADGKVTAIAEGTATITATIGGKSGQITINVIGAKYFTKVTDASTLKAKDTIILAVAGGAGTDAYAIVAGARNTDKKALSVVKEGVTITADAAAADQALQFVLGEATGGFTLTPVGSSTAIAIGSNSNDIVNATASNNKVWEFLADGTNGIYVHNTGTNTNGYGYLKYHISNNVIKAYKTTTTGAVYVYVYVRPYAEPVKPAATGISLNPTSWEMYVGDADKQLTATITPSDADQAVIWESSNTAVATVSANGKVHAVAKGTATITAKVKSNESLKAECALTVNEWEVTEVKFDEGLENTVEIGKTITVSATAYPTGHGFKVTYSSSDTEIATVSMDGGVVKGVAVGEVVIKATSGGKEATLTVHVINNDPTAIEAVSIKGRATKVLREGQIIIIREEKEFDVVGRQLK